MSFVSRSHALTLGLTVAGAVKQEGWFRFAQQPGQPVPAAAPMAAPGEPAANATSRDLLAVTGFWKITDLQGLHGERIDMPNEVPINMPVVMKLNAPLAFYGDSFGIQQLMHARGEAIPPVVAAQEVPIMDLPPCSSHYAQLFPQNPDASHLRKFTKPNEMPSIMTGCIWVGKMELLRTTATKFPEYPFYAWVDVGIHASRFDVVTRKDPAPWPRPQQLAKLPTNKVTVSTTRDCDDCKLGEWAPLCECISPTSIIVPKAVMDTIADLYTAKLKECFVMTQGPLQDSTPCMSEQAILTQAQLSRPELFHLFGKGFDRVGGDLVSKMFKSPLEHVIEATYSGQSDLFHYLSSTEGGLAGAAADRVMKLGNIGAATGKVQ